MVCELNHVSLTEISLYHLFLFVSKQRFTTEQRNRQKHRLWAGLVIFFKFVEYELNVP